VTKRLSSIWAAVATGILISPLVALVAWTQMQEIISIPTWSYGVLFFLFMVIVREIPYRIGPEGAYQPFFDIAGLSMKDKWIYLFSTIVPITTFIVFAEFAKDVNYTTIIVVLFIIIIGLFYLPARLFGSLELREKLFGSER